MSLTEQHDRDRQGHTESRPGTPTPYSTPVGTGEMSSTLFAIVQVLRQEKGKMKDNSWRASTIFAPTPQQHGNVEPRNVEDKFFSGEEILAIGLSDVQSLFSMLWKKKGIYKTKWQKWIQEKAYTVVNNQCRILKLRLRGI